MRQYAETGGTNSGSGPRQGRRRSRPGTRYPGRRTSCGARTSQRAAGQRQIGIPPASRFDDATLRNTVGAIASTSANDDRVVGLLTTMLLTMLGAIGLAIRRARQLGS